MKEEIVKTKKSVLGRGMASLIESSQQSVNVMKPAPQNSGQVLLGIDKISANKNQPRKIFNDSDLEELTASIRENGIIQPIIVREINKGEYQIIAGERRFRAAKKLGLKEVPVVVKAVTEKEMMVMAIIENIQRSDLNCIEEALAYYSLMNEYKLTQEELAKQLGKNRSSVANHLRLLSLPKETVSMLKEGQLSLGHGKILAAVKDAKLVEIYSKECVRNSLSVRELEELIKSQSNETKKKTKTTKIESSSTELEQIKRRLESHTGFHIKIKKNQKGAGNIQLLFTDKTQLNKIVEYFLK